MFTRVLWLLLLLPFSAMASWTGIAAFVGKSQSEWTLPSTIYQADIDFYGLRIEEKTEAELRVGASAGQFHLRLFDPLILTTAEKFNGRFLSVYLRWPIKLTDQIKFHTQVNYQYNLGEKSAEEDVTEISWTDLSLNMGLSLQLGLVSVRPFINISSMDGDITSSTGSLIFKHDEPVDKGLMLDYLVERTAYVRLMATSGINKTVSISFAREF